MPAILPAIVIVAAATIPVFAQENGDAPEQAEVIDELQPMQGAMSVHSLLELDVVTADGENMGQVYDLVADPGDGLLKFLVVTRGGMLGIAETRTAVPWHRVEVMGPARRFVLDMTLAEVEQLPDWEGARTEGSAISAAPATERPDQPAPAEAAGD